jgi:thioredoxin-like negative regulator of GroEL
MEELPDAEGDDRPVLLFFSTRRSGPARRMSSLVAWIRVTEKKRLRVVEIDADINPKLADVLEVSVVPSLVLLRGAEVLGRLEGRVTGREITRLIGPHVDGARHDPSAALGRSTNRS